MPKQFDLFIASIRQRLFELEVSGIQCANINTRRCVVEPFTPHIRSIPVPKHFHFGYALLRVLREISSETSDKSVL